MRMIYSAWVVASSLALVSPLIGGGEDSAKSEPGIGGLRAHEWGTFTTLHWSTGSSLSWYQGGWQLGGSPNAKGVNSVSDLPAFVHRGFAGKSSINGFARMETPVIYFYTDKRQNVDVAVTYHNGGKLTEFFPAGNSMLGSLAWNSLELIPAAEATELIARLPTDADRPDNHYFQARAVPEAAVVRMVQPIDGEGNQAPDQLEKFLFYRGVGSFDTGLHVQMQSGGTMSLNHYNSAFGMKHVWVVRSTSDAVRWEKLPVFPAYNSEAALPRVEVSLESLNAGANREASIQALGASMVAALIDSGLTAAEAAAMVATWDDQWYEEPGQRVFSIAPQVVIDAILPLTISPKPENIVRVFVHRAEILDPETQQALERAMAPGTAPKITREAIEKEQLGRFVFGAIAAVARDVGQRTTAAYTKRGLEAFVAEDEEVTMAAPPPTRGDAR